MSGAAVRVDRERFLAMVVALSAAACAKTASSSDAPIVVVATVDPISPDAAAPTAQVTAVEPADAPESSAEACAKANDSGEIDCSWVKRLGVGGPACEGVGGTCDLLAEGAAYRPRAAAAVATCFEQLGRRLCDIRARKKCYEEGVRAACPEPRFEAECDGRIDACRAAGVKVTYTRDECVKVLSALKGGDRDWALSAMGPSSEGRCRLMFTVM